MTCAGYTTNYDVNINNTDATNSKRHIQFCYFYEPFGGKCLNCLPGYSVNIDGTQCSRIIDFCD